MAGSSALRGVPAVPLRMDRRAKGFMSSPEYHKPQTCIDFIEISLCCKMERAEIFRRAGIDLNAVFCMSVKAHPDLATLEGLARAVPPGTSVLILQHIDEVIPEDQRNEDGVQLFMQRLIEHVGDPDLIVLSILPFELWPTVRL
jgi:hypothetical protein